MADEEAETAPAGEDTTQIAAGQVEQRIYTVRGQNVMLDSDLAELYGVETKNLNKAVQRNLSRFPEDFMFQLTLEEAASLRFQIGTSKQGRGGRRTLLHAFTEQGVAMLSSVLRSERAVQVNIAIMRAFVRRRGVRLLPEELAWKLLEMEKKYDAQFSIVFNAIRLLIEAPHGISRLCPCRFNRPAKRSFWNSAERIATLASNKPGKENGSLWPLPALRCPAARSAPPMPLG